ncbi:MAG: hypothetical protein COB02_01695 [Candidatus Cloacimonadota bacterium]|nr:MAG: hypothetical protein COB02_01695 [Candidatus Cloacimonadota bacterium]
MRLSLRNQLITIFFLFGLIPLFIASYYSINTVRKTITDLTQVQFHEISSAISTDTIDFFKSKQNQLKILSDSTFFRGQMTKGRHLKSFFKLHLQDFLKQNSKIHEVICLDSHSLKLNYYQSTHPQRLTLNVPKNIQQDFQNQKVYSLNKSAPLLSESKLNNQNIFSIFYPVLDLENKKHLLQATIKLDTLQNKFKNLHIGGLKQSIQQFLFILDSKDKLLYSPSFFTKANFDEYKILDQLKNSSTNQENYLNFFQKKYLSYQYLIPNFNWKIIILKNNDITLKTINDLSNKSFLILIVLLLSIFFTSIFISKAIFQPINHLKDIAYNYSHGNFDIEHTIQGQDEIAQLAQSMKIMGQDLQNYTKNLETTVKERTKELQASLVEVEKSKAETERSNKVKSEFLAVMSHELRTPLSGMLGSAELVQESIEDIEIKELTEIIKTSASALTILVNDILEYIQLDENKVLLSIKDFNLEEEIEEVIESLLFKAKKINTEIILDYDFGVPLHYIGDAERIRIILYNLIDNAIKFSPKGKVYIHIKSENLSENKAIIQIEIIDNGIGISQKQMNSIFGLFYQVDSSHTRRQGGTGLGLTLATKLLELMNSKLSIQSEIKKGSTFSFKLPLPYCNQYSPLVDKSLKTQTIAIFSEDEQITKILINKFSDYQIQAYSIIPNEENGQFNIKSMDIFEPPIAILIDKSNVYPHKTILDFFNNSDFHKNTPKILLTKQSSFLSKLEIKLGYDQIIQQPIYSSKIKLLTDSILNKNVNNTNSNEFFNKDFLLVEDNLSNQIYAKIFLQRLGATITVVNNGEEAIQILYKNSFDLILMDCLMPVMDGFEATKTIRKNQILDKKNKKISIIALTAIATKSDLDNCIDCGMNDIIHKPINRKKALNIIKKYL